MCAINLLLYLFLNLPGLTTENPVEKINKQISRDIMLGIHPPPAADSIVHCFHYSELLRVRIDKNSHAADFSVSDGSSEWMRGEVKRILNKGKFSISKIDSITKKHKIRNIDLVIPVIVESDDFPCGEEKKQKKIPKDFYKFNGQLLKGNISFSEEVIVWIPTMRIF